MFFFCPSQHPVFEFHISREIRDFYQIDENIFAQNGNVIFTNFFAVRSLAARMNKKRDLTNYPEQAVKAGQLNAMGLIDEILHYIVGLYKEANGTDLFADALKYLNQEIGQEESEYLLNKFVSDFPPLSVYRQEMNVKKYLSKKTGTISNKEITLEEIFLFYLANQNPAFSPFKELFDDTIIGKETRYRKSMNALYDFFAKAPFFGPDNQNLFEMLRTPAIKHPNSLTDQLEFIRRHLPVND